MKRVKIAIGILVFISLLTAYLTIRLDFILDEFSAQIDLVEQALESGGDVKSAATSATECWESHTSELTRFIPQYRVDDITATAVRLPFLSEMDDKAEFEAELNTIRNKIKQMWEAHSPSLSSLF